MRLSKVFSNDLKSVVSCQGRPFLELEMNWMYLGSKGKTPHVGARLKALDEAVLMAVSDFSCNFVCILSSRFEQCGLCSLNILHECSIIFL